MAGLLVAGITTVTRGSESAQTSTASAQVSTPRARSSCRGRPGAQARRCPAAASRARRGPARSASGRISAPPRARPGCRGPGSPGSDPTASARPARRTRPGCSGCADQADPAARALPSIHASWLSPAHEVVHLLEIDPPAVPRELAANCAPPVRRRASRSSWRRRPRRGGRPSPAPARLGAAVHRRGVHHAAAGVEQPVDDGVGPCCSAAGRSSAATCRGRPRGRRCPVRGRADAWSRP